MRSCGLATRPLFSAKGCGRARHRHLNSRADGDPYVYAYGDAVADTAYLWGHAHSYGGADGSGDAWDDGYASHGYGNGGADDNGGAARNGDADAHVNRDVYIAPGHPHQHAIAYEASIAYPFADHYGGAGRASANGHAKSDVTARAIGQPDGLDLCRVYPDYRGPGCGLDTGAQTPSVTDPRARVEPTTPVSR